MPPPVGVDHHDAPFMNWHRLARQPKNLIGSKKIYEAVWPLITRKTHQVDEEIRNPLYVLVISPSKLYKCTLPN